MSLKEDVKRLTIANKMIQEALEDLQRIIQETRHIRERLDNEQADIEKEYCDARKRRQLTFQNIDPHGNWGQSPCDK